MANRAVTTHRRHPMSVTVTCSHPPAPSGGPSGISPLAAKILDQLSLTAWLPAALLMANVYLVAGMFLVRNPDRDPTARNLKAVVEAIDSKAIGVIVAVLLGIVLATLITQSLELAAIRFLEGYWGGSVYSAVPTHIGIRIQQRRQYLIAARLQTVDRHAFKQASDAIHESLTAREGTRLADAAIALALDRPTPPGLDTETQSRAQDVFGDKQRWRPLVSPHLRHRARSLEVRAAAFPSDDSRLLPTRLGCTLRSFEDQLNGDVAGNQMRSYLYNHLDRIKPVLLEQHNQYRNRLDMCAVLTVLCLLLAALDALLLPRLLPAPYVLWACTGLIILSYLSYRGAVAAALDYGPILLAIDTDLRSDARVN